MPFTSFSSLTAEFEKKSNSNYSEKQDNYVNLKVDPTNKDRMVAVRPVGHLFSYLQHSPRKRNNNPKIVDKNGKMLESIEVPFPDEKYYSDNNKKQFNRICYKPYTDKYGECPWCKLGFDLGPRYAMVVIERGRKGEPDKVKILEKGKMLFKHFIDKAENNRKLNEEGLSKIKRWTVPGGVDAPDFIVSAKFNNSTYGKSDYSVEAEPQASPITEEEVELLKAVRKITPEDLEKAKKAVPGFEDYPDWFFYGFDLEKRYAPTLIQETVEDTSAEDMDLDNPFETQIPDVEDEKASEDEPELLKGKPKTESKDSSAFDPNW